MNYNIVSHLVGDGLKNVLKNKKSTITAILIMFATMVTVGLGIAGGKNVTNIIKQLEKSYPIEVFIEDTATKADIEKLGDEIKSVDYVGQVQYISKSEALSIARDNLGDMSSVLDQYTETNHPFPASYKVTLTDLKKSNEVIETIKKFSNIKEVSTQQTTIDGLNRLERGIKFAFFAVGGLLIFVSIVIISNTIKLTVHARRKEISIMKYVGATNNFIRAPFIVEGVVIGIVAMAISLMVLGICYHVVFNAFNSKLFTMIKCNLMPFNGIFGDVLLVYAALGIGIGVLGSMLSMKKYLKV